VSLALLNHQVNTRPAVHTFELRHSTTSNISRRTGTTGPTDGTMQRRRIADTAQRSNTRTVRSRRRCLEIFNCGDYWLW